MPDASSRSLIGLPEFRALVVARATNALAMSALTTVVAFQVYDLTRDPLSLGWLGLVFIPPSGTENVLNYEVNLIGQAAVLIAIGMAFYWSARRKDY